VLAVDTTLAQLVKRAEPLTEYAWALRDPGEAAEPSADEVREALDLTREVIEAILGRLPPDVRP
jgi:hypothetical protein